MSRHVYILGKGPSVVGLEVEPGAEAWGFNAGRDPAATRWFQMHPLRILPKDEMRAMRWAVAAGVPLYTLRHHPTLRGTLCYPFDVVVDALGCWGVDAPVWTSSFDYMLALAIVEGFARITIAGADLAGGTTRERMVEHVGLAYWVGVARGLGRTVDVPGQAVRFPFRYGYHYHVERDWARRECRDVVAQSLRMRLDDEQAR
jgi:hypothetical protein